MKYMLLIYTPEDAYTQDEREACYQESIELTRALKAKNKYIHASPLQLVNTAKSVRVRGPKSEITDGPFAETREQLGGYFLVDADSEEEALEIASQIPGARVGTVEVRPVVELTGLPEAEF